MAADAVLKVDVGCEGLVAERAVEPRHIEPIERIRHELCAAAIRSAVTSSACSINRPRNSSHVPRTRSGWPVKSSR